jgi:uncharacterized membrane protein
MTTKFSKREAIQFGWKMAKSNLGFFVGLMIIWFLISIVFSGISQRVMEANFLLGIILGIVFFVLYVIVRMGFVKISLKFCDNEKAKFSDLFSQSRLFFKFLFATALYNLIISVLIGVPIVPIILGIIYLFTKYLLFAKSIYSLIIFGGALLLILVLLIVVGIILRIRFSFYTYFVIDKNSGPIESLRRSFIITKEAVWDLFVFSLMLIGINLLGALCLLIGLFATIPTTMIAKAFVYRKLLVKTETAETKADVNNDQQVF